MPSESVGRSVTRKTRKIEARVAAVGHRFPVRILVAALTCVGIGGLVAAGIYVARPLDTDRFDDVATTVLAEDGRLLELRLNSEGRWRERVTLHEIDPDLVAAMLAYEDRRFYSHIGIDPIAVARATLSFVTTGRVVSGASSVTMQVARLMEPDLRQRSLAAKFRQMWYALRLEYHWSKSEILRAYFELAPYGGNVEGIKAASMAWLQKPPAELPMTEIGFLVALPQAPEQRRPDRHPQAAVAAKNHVLRSVADHLAIDANELDEHLDEGLRLARYAPPSLAPHLLDRNLADRSYAFGRPTTINADWQETATRIMAQQVQRLGPPINGAALVVERDTGHVRIYVGSADYLDAARKGAVNYLRAKRSPGSTLKPLIYAAALDRRLVGEHHVFDDRRLQRGGYAPVNFDGTYSGAITLREALLRSRNIPAIDVLHALGETTFENQLRSFLGSSVGHAEPAGLSLAVGGFHLTVESLAELYLNLLDPSSAPRLQFVEDSPESLLYPEDDGDRHPGIVGWPAFSGEEAIDHGAQPLATQTAADTIQRLLAVTLPNGRIRVAKTGTSHGRQDALAVLVTRHHLIVVWFGTPDHEPTEVLTGVHVALPFAEQLQAALGLDDPVVVLHTTDPEPPGAMVRSCPRLIDFPESGEWIRTDDNHIAVSGAGRDLAWFLDGIAVTIGNAGIPVPTGGAYRVTAAAGECRETAEVFVELVD